MTTLADALDAAVGDGIITATQAERLTPFLLDRGVGADAVGSDGATPIIADDARAAEESEQPRFVRGFHDILITIGIVVALVGLWGIGSIFAVLPAIVVLAEILIRRQRLALPAVALTVALIQWAAVLSAMLDEQLSSSAYYYTRALYLIPVFSILLAAFYWRYRVPLALAALLFSLFLLAMDLVIILLTKAMGVADLLVEHSGLVATVFFVGALGLFTAAMIYDVADPARRTRQSDVAFWLHLAAAPALLYAMLSFIFLRTASGEWWGETTSPGDAAAVLAIVVVFMVIGLVIDRRAFVTSGLLSLGLAIWTILQRGGIDFGDYFSVTVLAVGVVVLMVGIFWQALRRTVLSVLPGSITRHLHPVPAPLA